MADTKLTLDEVLKKEAIQQHNSALGNVAAVIGRITETRRNLAKLLADCDTDEAKVRALAERTEEDPILVNDSDELHSLFQKYGEFGSRGGGKLRRV